jgi:cation:H+ antiporter
MSVALLIMSLVVGFFLLVRGSDAFVDGAGRLATRLGIPPMVVGLTIVALGTSAPEVAISVSSSFQAADQLTIANVFGSNIINTLVILGVVALVAEVPMTRSTLMREIPFVLVATVLMLGLCLHDGVLGRGDAVLLLVLLAGYLFHLVRSVRGEAGASNEGVAQEDGTPWARLVATSVAGAAAVAVGAHLAVTGATGIARLLGMSDRLVGLTVVALGTSLPELVTSVTAARKGNTEVAIGNVVGSSILNVLFVLGMSGIVAPIPFAPNLLLDGVVTLAATALVWVLGVRRRSLGRGSGVAMLASYAAYMAHVINFA